MMKLFTWTTSATGRLNPAQERDILTLMQLGREVEAVKQIRRWTNASLPDAVGIVAGYRVAPRPLAGD